MAAITICSDFGAPKNKVWHCFHCFPIYLSWPTQSEGFLYVLQENETSINILVHNKNLLINTLQGKWLKMNKVCYSWIKINTFMEFKLFTQMTNHHAKFVMLQKSQQCICKFFHLQLPYFRLPQISKCVVNVGLPS